MTLKELRKQKKLTQAECASYLGIPLRTYQNYENDGKKTQSIKYEYMLQKLAEYGLLDETHGVLSRRQIADLCADVFAGKEISYCYLFGSYAKGLATPASDVDLLVSTPISGMAFYDLVEELREKLKKNVDVLNQAQLKDNLPLVEEILKDGVKIYESDKRR